ncbi:response regulator [Pseudomonas sp. H9]|uniref:response regulator n=1 Tax=Pseudomonas sp. H9 TaxID=483968 RepID=UPI00140497B6|nr:response regulator [Pseudomonas sp. H9]
MSRIIIADPHPLIRYALSQFLASQGHQIVAALADGASALHETLALRPHLLVLGLDLPRLGGLEVIQRLRQRGSSVAVLVLTSQSNEHFASLCLQAGATGFIGKEQDLAALSLALASVLDGRSYFPAESLPGVISGSGQGEERELLKRLSPREVTVLRYLVNGRSNKSIADELAISNRTVSTYKTRLLEKLKTDSLAGLMEIAWRNGLLQVISTEPKEPSDSPLGAQEPWAAFMQTFSSAPEPITLRNAQGQLLAANQCFLDLYGVDREQVIGKRLLDSEVLSAQERKRVDALYREAYTREEPFTGEIVIHLHGHERRVRYWGVPYRDSQQRMVAMIGSSREVQPADQALNTLHDRLRKSESLRRTRVRYLQDAGQLFLQALTQVRSALEEKVAPRARQAAIRATNDMTERVELLLDVLQLENRNVQLAVERVDLLQLTAFVVNAFNERSTTRYTLDVGAVPERCQVWVDPLRYQQMLDDLLIHFDHYGALTLRVTALETAADELQWCLEPELDTAQAEAAWRSTSARTLHLSRCEQLALLMNGSLEVITGIGPTLAQLQIVVLLAVADQ